MAICVSCKNKLDKEESTCSLCGADTQKKWEGELGSPWKRLRFFFGGNLWASLAAGSVMLPLLLYMLLLLYRLLAERNALAALDRLLSVSIALGAAFIICTALFLLLYSLKDSLREYHYKRDFVERFRPPLPLLTVAAFGLFLVLGLTLVFALKLWPSPRPVISTITPQMGFSHQLTSPLSIIVRAEAEAGIERVELWGYGAGQQVQQLYGTWESKGATGVTVTFNWMPTGAGVVNFFARVVDRAGGHADSATVSGGISDPKAMVADVSGPTANITYPQAGFVYHTTGVVPVTVQAQAQQGLESIELWGYYASLKAEQPCAPAINGQGEPSKTISFTCKPCSAGPMDLFARVLDKRGRWTESPKVSGYISAPLQQAGGPILTTEAPSPAPEGGAIITRILRLFFTIALILALVSLTLAAMLMAVHSYIRRLDELCIPPPVFVHENRLLRVLRHNVLEEVQGTLEHARQAREEFRELHLRWTGQDYEILAEEDTPRPQFCQPMGKQGDEGLKEKQPRFYCGCEKLIRLDLVDMERTEGGGVKATVQYIAPPEELEENNRVLIVQHTHRWTVEADEWGRVRKLKQEREKAPTELLEMPEKKLPVAIQVPAYFSMPRGNDGSKR
jgi:hypothetical protein